MKPALRLIPTEVWVDVFCYPWISRRKLGRIVDRFRNSYFVEILQYCLHERGKRTLGVMRLDNEKSLPLIPMTPMPDNIKFFNLIIIGHYDSTTIDFLRRINTLFTGVNLFSNGIHPAEIRTILDRISPLIHGIHSLRFEDFEIPVIEQYFAPKLAQVKMIELHTDSLDSIQQTTINFCMNWLEQRDQMEPRLLKVHIASKNFQKFSDAIQQQFLTERVRSHSQFVSQFGVFRIGITLASPISN